MPKKYPIDKSFGIFAKFSPPFGRCAFALARAALLCMPKGLRGGTEVVKYAAAACAETIRSTVP